MPTDRLGRRMENHGRYRIAILKHSVKASVQVIGIMTRKTSLSIYKLLGINKQNEKKIRE